MDSEFWDCPSSPTRSVTCLSQTCAVFQVDLQTCWFTRVLVLQVSLDYSREEKVNHDEVLEICEMRAEVLQKLVTRLISRCQQQNINTH